MTSAEGALKFWQELNLPSYQKQLDSFSTDIYSLQDTSEKARKNLVELTREFKKTTSEENKKLFGGVLRAYQKEVDSLSKRAKKSESYFLDVYKSFADAPNPAPLLEVAVSNSGKIARFHELEMENTELRATLGEYNKEFADVKNQEATVNKLKRELKEMKDSIEEQAQMKIENERELEQEDIRRQFDMLKQEQKDLEVQLNNAEQKALAYQRKMNNIQAEFLEFKSKADAATAGQVVEAEMVNSELERAVQRAVEAEKAKEDLLAKLSSLQKGGEKGAGEDEEAAMQRKMSEMSQNALENEVAAKEREIVRLNDDLQGLRKEVIESKKRLSIQISSLEKDVAEKNSHLEFVETKLEEMRDYDDIKKELNVLKVIEFSGQIELGMEKPLDVMLMEKNRKLNSDNTDIRNELMGSKSKLKELEKSVAASAETIESQKKLIVKLEKDLLDLNKAPNGQGGIARVTESPYEDKSSAQLLESLVGGESDGGPLHNNSESPANHIQRNNTAAPPPAPIPGGDILDIITSQRDRFREKNTQLEADNLSLQQGMASLRSEIDSLRKDNIKLYEKIKFLQGYGRSNKQPGGSSANDDVMSKYQGAYDEEMNPFNQFNKTEKTKRIASLNAADRTTLSIGRWILASKQSRNFVFFYAILLHALVFITLFKFSGQTCVVPQSVAEHLEESEFTGIGVPDTKP
eukprot:Nk52_evm16s262 gene=Nk52_evmTU16s262